MHDIEPARNKYRSLVAAALQHKREEEQAMKGLILSLRDGTPVELVGYNEDLLRQVNANSLWRKVYKLLDAPLAPSVLFVHVLVDGEEMLLDTDAIMIRFFAPRTTAQKWAVGEAEACVLYVRNHVQDEVPNLRRMAYANELMWLAVTDQLKGEEVIDYSKPTHRVIAITATWNEFEPTIGFMPYDYSM